MPIACPQSLNAPNDKPGVPGVAVYCLLEFAVSNCNEQTPKTGGLKKEATENWCCF